MNLRRVGLIIAAIVLVETVAFVVVNRDLVYLSQPMSRLRAEPQEGFRAMAERALARDRVARRHLERMAEVTAANGDADLRLKALRRLAKDFPADPARRTEWIKRVAQKSGLQESRVTELLERYGTAAEIYAVKTTSEKERPLKSLPGYTVGEIEGIVANEYVLHLSDLVCRRSLIALLGDAREEVLRELAGIAGPLLHWDRVRQEQEVKRASWFE